MVYRLVFLVPQGSNWKWDCTGWNSSFYFFYCILSVFLFSFLEITSLPVVECMLRFSQSKNKRLSNLAQVFLQVRITTLFDHIPSAIDSLTELQTETTLSFLSSWVGGGGGVHAGWLGRKDGIFMTESTQLRSCQISHATSSLHLWAGLDQYWMHTLPLVTFNSYCLHLISSREKKKKEWDRGDRQKSESWLRS